MTIMPWQPDSSKIIRIVILWLAAAKRTSTFKKIALNTSVLQSISLNTRLVGIIQKLTLSLTLILSLPSCTSISPSITFNEADATDLSRHAIKYTRVNGLNYAYIESGSGPLVLLLHGFAEGAGIYDSLLESLAERGYRAVAPFARGYVPTEIPIDQDYRVLTLANDIIELIRMLGETESYLVGNDWGATTAYAVANLAPEKITKMITLSVPHPRNIKLSLAAIYRARHIVLFNLPYIAEHVVERDDFAYIDQLFERWSPSWKLPEKEKEKSKYILNLQGRLSAALGYYRSLLDGPRNEIEKKQFDLLNQKTKVPTLFLHGGKDGAIKNQSFDKLNASFSTEFKTKLFPDGGHFLHLQYPDSLLEAVICFFNNNR